MPFNMGPMELVIVLIILLVLFGAKRIPEIGSGIGKGIREFKRSMSDVQNQINAPERDERIERDVRTVDRLPAEPHRTDEDRPEPKRLLS
jgi:sec-independent protein translocase protein TatA